MKHTKRGRDEGSAVLFGLVTRIEGFICANPPIGSDRMNEYQSFALILFLNNNLYQVKNLNPPHMSFVFDSTYFSEPNKRAQHADPTTHDLEVIFHRHSCTSGEFQTGKQDGCRF